MYTFRGPFLSSQSRMMALPHHGAHQGSSGQLKIKKRIVGPSNVSSHKNIIIIIPPRIWESLPEVRNRIRVIRLKLRSTLESLKRKVISSCLVSSFPTQPQQTIIFIHICTAV